MTEKQLQAKIRDAMNRTGKCRIFSSPTGMLPNGRGGYMRFGLTTGGSDLVGLLKPSGRWLSIEVKLPGGKISPEQLIFQKTIRNFGGVSEICYSVEDALEVLDKTINGEL